MPYFMLFNIKYLDIAILGLFFFVKTLDVRDFLAINDSALYRDIFK